METPLVTIMIPVYNREQIVCRALNATLAQTYNNLEVVVCDNASTDGTWDTLQQYANKDSRVKIYRNETNLGPVRNWVKCLEHATGKYAKYLWSDDEISPTFVEIMVDALEKNQDCGFAYSNVKIIRTSESHEGVYRYADTGYYDTISFVESTLCGTHSVPVSPGCALFRLEDIKQNLSIDIPNNKGINFSSHGAGNDLLMFLRCCPRYQSFYFDEQNLSTFYGGDDSISITKEKLVKYSYEIAKLQFINEHKKEYCNLRKKYYDYIFYYSDFEAKDFGLQFFKFYIETKRNVKKKILHLWTILNRIIAKL